MVEKETKSARDLVDSVENIHKLSIKLIGARLYRGWSAARTLGTPKLARYKPAKNHPLREFTPKFYNEESLKKWNETNGK